MDLSNFSYQKGQLKLKKKIKKIPSSEKNLEIINNEENKKLIIEKKTISVIENPNIIEEISKMTPSEIKQFQYKNKFIAKRNLEFSDKTFNEITSKLSEELKKKPMHNDLEGD